MIFLTRKLSPSHLLVLKRCWISHNSVSCSEYDIVVIGGGIIGTATAKTLKENIRHARVALLEKENDFAQHQSSHNSHIIHGGIYYEPNSLKAKLCVEGLNLIYEYCNNNNIPFKRNGKLIIASNVLDTYRLNELYKRGLKNKVPGLTLLKNWKDVIEIQPFCKGAQALWSPNTGTVDWQIVAKKFAEDFKQEQGEIFLNCEIGKIENSGSSSYPVLLEDTKLNRIFLAKYVVKCLGLYSGTLENQNKNDTYKNISLKITYRFLHPQLSHFVKTNIYAMPEIEMPFVGVHISPLMDGNVLLGPSAIPAFKLDCYKDGIDLNYIRNNIFSPGFTRLFLNNFQTCLNQVTQTFCIDVETETLKKYFPMISKMDILPGPKALQGQIVKTNGELVDDFLIEMFEGSGIHRRIVNCRFVPSPGATSSLAIAKMITREMTSQIFLIGTKMNRGFKEKCF